MGTFANSDELIRVMRQLWEGIKSDPDMSDQLIRSKLIVQFRYRDPEGIITIDCSDGAEFRILDGICDLKPTIEMSMRANVAHEFWMGRISIPVAILTGKIVSRGPTPKALALLPVIKPAFSLYSEIMEKSGKAGVIKR